MLSCEICGCNTLVKRDDYFVCDNCGTKYPIEKAKELIDKEKRKEFCNQCSDAHKNMDKILHSFIYEMDRYMEFKPNATTDMAIDKLKRDIGDYIWNSLVELIDIRDNKKSGENYISNIEKKTESYKNETIKIIGSLDGPVISRSEALPMMKEYILKLQDILKQTKDFNIEYMRKNFNHNYYYAATDLTNDLEKSITNAEGYLKEIQTQNKDNYFQYVEDLKSTITYYERRLRSVKQNAYAN